MREYGRKHVPHFVGVFPNDRVPAQQSETETLIVNDSPAGTAGRHWTALFRSGPRAVFWDSYGRPASELLPHIDAEDCDSDREQRVNERWCGAGCLSWLQVCASLGPDAAKTV